MHAPTRLRMTALSPHLACGLCRGYLVDATTIVECLHSFCKTCIVRYLSYNKCCPTCRVLVHKTKPLLNIREDKSLQDLVYKLVPNLFKDEMKRRRDFYNQHPHQAAIVNKEQRGEVPDLATSLVSTEENISLQIQLCDRLPPYNNSCKGEDTSESVDTRYLNCPALFTIGHLKKFLKLKFDLSCNYKTEVFHSDEPLKDEYTLVDIGYLYNWRRDGPLKLFYIVFDKTVTDYKFYIPTPVIEAPIVSNNSNNDGDMDIDMDSKDESKLNRKSNQKESRKRSLSPSPTQNQVTSSSEVVPAKKEKRTVPRIPKLKIRKVPKLHFSPSPNKEGKHKHLKKTSFTGLRDTDSPMEVVILPPSPDSSSDVPDLSRIQGSSEEYAKNANRMVDIQEEIVHDTSNESGSSDSSSSDDSEMDTSSSSTDSSEHGSLNTSPKMTPVKSLKPCPKVTPVKLKFTHKDNSLSCTPVDIRIVPKDTSTPAFGVKPVVKKSNDKTLFEKLFGELSTSQKGNTLLDSPSMSNQTSEELFMDPGTRSEGFNASAGSDSKEESSLTSANESNLSLNASQKELLDIKQENSDAQVVVQKPLDTKSELIKIIKTDVSDNLDKEENLESTTPECIKPKSITIKKEVIDQPDPILENQNVHPSTSLASTAASSDSESKQPLYSYLSSVMGQERKSRPVAAWVRRKEEMNNILPRESKFNPNKERKPQTVVSTVDKIDTTINSTSDGRESKLNLAIRKIKEKQLGKSPERPTSASSEKSSPQTDFRTSSSTTVKATTWMPTAPGLLPPSSTSQVRDASQSLLSNSQSPLSKVKIENGASSIVYATPCSSRSSLEDTEGVDLSRMSLLEQYCLKNVVRSPLKSGKSTGAPNLVTNTSKPFSISELAPSEIIIEDKQPSASSSSLEKLKQFASFHNKTNAGSKSNDSILQICPTPVQGKLKGQTQCLTGAYVQGNKSHSCGKFVPVQGKDHGRKQNKEEVKLLASKPAQLLSAHGHHTGSRFQIPQSANKTMASLAAMYASGQQKAAAMAALRQQALLHGHSLPAQLPSSMRQPVRRNPGLAMKSPSSSAAASAGSNSRNPARPAAKYPPRHTYPPQPTGLKDVSIHGPRISSPLSMCSPFPYESYMYTSGGVVMVGSQMKSSHLPISQPYSPYARNSISTPSPTSLSPASPVSPGQNYRLHQQEIPEDLSVHNNGYDAPLDFSKKPSKAHAIKDGKSGSKGDDGDSSGDKVLLKVPSLLRP